MTTSRFTLWSFSLAAALWIFLRFFSASVGFFQPDAPFAILITLGGITCLLYYFLTRPADPRAFATNYLLTLVLKMVTFLALIGILAFISPESLTDNAVFGLLAYVAFTVLEVLALYRYKSRA